MARDGVVGHCPVSLARMATLQPLHNCQPPGLVSSRIVCGGGGGPRGGDDGDGDVAFPEAGLPFRSGVEIGRPFPRIDAPPETAVPRHPPAAT
jgi:hypothetical protein